MKRFLIWRAKTDIEKTAETVLTAIAGDAFLVKVDKCGVSFVFVSSGWLHSLLTKSYELLTEVRVVVATKAVSRCKACLPR